MNFSFLTDVFQKLEKTSSRLEMTDIVAKFLAKTPSEQLPLITLFLRGNAFPLWSDKELGVADKIMVLALSNVSGVKDTAILDSLRQTGDLGKTAEQILVRKAQTTLFTQKLTIGKVHENLERLTELGGKGSQDKKVGYISELLSFASAADSKYIVRLILGELRLGVGEGTVRDAIAKAFKVEPGIVEKAYCLTSDLGEVARIARKEGQEGLEEIKVKIGRPIRVMLALKKDSIDKALDDLGKVALETKYDGVRVQIHKEKEKVELYTRRLENVTNQFPEIVESARDNIEADSAIVEGEVVAINPDRTPKPFQNLSRRIKRKYDIKEIVKKIPVEINLFDIIFLNGKQLLDEEFQDRRKLLQENIQTTQTFRLADQLITEDVKEAEEFYKKALDMGHEGVMVKTLNAPYQPGSRVGYMYKIKPIMETLDLVVVGATWGEGRRASWLGSYLLATRDQDTGELLTIGRMATGLTDKLLEELTDTLKQDILEQSGTEVKLKPTLVMEIAYEEIQKSPTYESGYALRFPRLVRIRDDKGPNDVDTLNRIEEVRGN